MTPTQSLIIGNLLNGVSADATASALGETPEECLRVFEAVMARVAEYALIHCVPHFRCDSLGAARLHRFQILSILSQIDRWDELDHDLVLDLFRGQDVVAKYGVTRQHAEQALQRVLDALPHYLQAHQAGAYMADRGAWIAAHRAEVMAVVDRFQSFDNPLQYQRIEHQMVSLA